MIEAAELLAGQKLRRRSNGCNDAVQFSEPPSVARGASGQGPGGCHGGERALLRRIPGFRRDGPSVRSSDGQIYYPGGVLTFLRF